MIKELPRGYRLPGTIRKMKVALPIIFYRLAGHATLRINNVYKHKKRRKMIFLTKRKTMKVLHPLKTLALLCTASILWTSCRKEVSASADEKERPSRLSGLLRDDSALVRKVPLLLSSDFTANGDLTARRRKDRDADGIPDDSDACPTLKETMNGYQDSDGCPDTLPGATDTDGDGIADTADGCPAEAETVNGYQDLDGCPDEIPPPAGDSSRLAPVVLPSRYVLAMPPVGNQGGESSCMAWATAYARSAEYFYSTGATSYSTATNIVSPEYIYNLAKVNSDCYSGTAFILTLNLLVEKGVCTWASMPYSSTNGCSSVPTPTQDIEAANFKIPLFSRIYNYDQAAIKTMIYTKHPVLTGATIDQNFRNAFPGYIWNTYSGFSGDHGLVICGYDDAKHAFLAINGWGTNWGEAGYIWIDYDFFPTISSYYLYVMR
jgi:hypothetical protein